MLLWRIKHKQPDGIVTSGLETQVSEQAIKLGHDEGNSGTSWNASCDNAGDSKTVIQQFLLLAWFDGDPGSFAHLPHFLSDVL